MARPTRSRHPLDAPEPVSESTLRLADDIPGPSVGVDRTIITEVASGPHRKLTLSDLQVFISEAYAAGLADTDEVTIADVGGKAHTLIATQTTREALR